MDPNPFSNPPLGFLLFGLVMVLLLAAIIYALGAWGAGKMRQGRIDNSSDIPYPDQPHSRDDRETVQHVQSRESSPERVTTQEQADQLAVGGDRKVIAQTSHRDERPIDAADRDKNARQVDRHASEARNPAREQGQSDKGGAGPDPL